MTASALLAWMCAAGAFLLVCAYAAGTPLILVHTLATVGRRRRRRYRPRLDDGLATSRFTIPVSIVLAVDEGDDDLVESTRQLLDLRYPELEVIVVFRSPRAPGIETLRRAFALSPCELFFRRTLHTPPIAAISRSPAEPRLLVAVLDDGSAGDARNCGVNLARFRYVCVARAAARYRRDALLECMQAALEDPSRVVGVTAAVEEERAGGSPDRLRLFDALRYASAARRRLSALGRRRVGLPPEGPVGFSIWRRDVLLEVGGFSTELNEADADMIFRVHRQFMGRSDAYRLLHLNGPVGTVSRAAARTIAVSTRVTAAVLLRHAGLLFNPRAGRLGLLDLPRFALHTFLAPWIEGAALLLVLLAPALGVLSPGEVLLVLFIIGFGNGVQIAAALLLDTEAVASLSPSSLLNLTLAGPCEYFIARPARLR